MRCAPSNLVINEFFRDLLELLFAMARANPACGIIVLLVHVLSRDITVACETEGDL